MKRTHLSLAAFAAMALALSGCGGAGGGSPTKNGKPFSIKVTWPARTRMIPKAAGAIKLTVVLKSGGTPVSAILYRPKDHSDAGVTKEYIPEFGYLDPGEYRVAAQAYVTKEAGTEADPVLSDEPIAGAEQEVKVTAGTTTPLSITMGTTVTRFLVNGLKPLIDPGATPQDDYYLLTNGQWKGKDGTPYAYLPFVNTGSTTVTLTPQDDEGNTLLIAKGVNTLGVSVGGGLSYESSVGQQGDSATGLSGTITVVSNAPGTFLGLNYKDGVGESAIDMQVAGNIVFTSAGGGVVVSSSLDASSPIYDALSFNLKEDDEVGNPVKGANYNSGIVTTSTPQVDGVIDHTRKFKGQMSLYLKDSGGANIPFLVTPQSTGFNLPTNSVSFDASAVSRANQLIQDYPAALNSAQQKRGQTLTIESIVAKVAGVEWVGKTSLGTTLAKDLPNYTFPMTRFKFKGVVRSDGDSTKKAALKAISTTGAEWTFETDQTGKTSKAEEVVYIEFYYALNAADTTRLRGTLVDSNWDGVGRIKVTVTPNGGDVIGGVD